MTGPTLAQFIGYGLASWAAGYCAGVLIAAFRRLMHAAGSP